MVPAEGPAALARDQQEDDDSGDRPTMVPAFDPEAFARDSEVRLRAASATGEPTVDGARRLLEGGDPEAALFLLSRLLEVAPLHREASALSQECRAALERECVSAVGSLSTVLVVAVSPAELMGHGLDQMSGFLISLLDGATDLEGLLDVCGQPRLLALRRIRDLVARGVVRALPRR
jgi:hypothetical protein